MTGEHVTVRLSVDGDRVLNAVVYFQDGLSKSKPKRNEVWLTRQGDLMAFWAFMHNAVSVSRKRIQQNIKETKQAAKERKKESARKKRLRAHYAGPHRGSRVVSGGLPSLGKRR